jgi:heptosyltransferase-3
MERFLVINVSRIGDTLLATPALRAIAAAYPGCQIDFLGHPKRAEVMRHLHFLYQVGTITKKSAPWRGWHRLFSGPAYDWAIVYGFDQPLVRYALRISRRVVAFRQKDESLNSRLYRVVEQPPFQCEHSVLQLLRLPATLDIPPAGLRLAYQVTEEEVRWAKEKLAKDLPTNAGPLIGLQVASFPGKGYRDWPMENFIALCRRIQQSWSNVHFLIFGGSQELARTILLENELGNAATRYAGRLSLRQTVALMSRSDLYIGVDTGPTHLMSTLDIPMVALYHCFSPSSLIGPLEHPRAYLIDHPRADEGCKPEVPMAEITVDRVWEVVCEALAVHCGQ